MPYISIRTTKKLETTQKEVIKTTLGDLITIIPGKSENNLMVDFSTSEGLFFQGKELSPGAYVEIKLYGEAEFEAKEKFTKSVFNLLDQQLEIPVSSVYITIMEYNTWGISGELK